MEYNPEYAKTVADFDVVPAGEYSVLISDVEDKESQRTGGKYLKLTLTIIDGKHKGMTITDLINYDNPNPKATEIAWRTLKRIARCVFGTDDRRFSSGELIGRKVRIISKVEEDGEYQNARVKNYVLPTIEDAATPPPMAPATNRAMTPDQRAAQCSHASTPPPKAPPVPSEDEDDSDVPF